MSRTTHAEFARYWSPAEGAVDFDDEIATARIDSDRV
jgi:hypothetical protein